MKAHNGLIKKLLIAVLTVGLLSACGGKEERKAKYLERGKAYLAEKNYEKAVIEFKNVLQIDPKDANGYLFIGQIEEKRQNWAKALGAYKKSSELDPEMIEPRVPLARFYLAQASAFKARNDEAGVANSLGLVQEQIKEIRARDPENLEALTLEAALWVNDGDVDKAVPQLEKVIKRAPGLESAALMLSGLYDQQERPDEAEIVLVDAIKASTDPVEMQQRLAVHYINNKQNGNAEAVLRRIVEENPDKLDYRLTLASFLSRAEQIDDAEQVLNEAISADPEDAQRYLLLTEFLASRKSKEVAIEKLQQFIQQQPDMTDLQLALVRLYLSNEQKNEARAILQSLMDSRGMEPAGLKARVVFAQLLMAEDINDERVPVLLQEVLDENPRDNGALLLKGKLAANNKDYTGSINNFRSVLKDQPNNEEVLQLLAASHLANGEKHLALDTLRGGVDSNPDSATLRVSLARLLAQEGDIDRALVHVDAVLKVEEHNQPALRTKYELLARKGDAEGMAEVTRLMQEGAPESEEGYIREARLRFAEKKYDDANAILDKVLARSPNSFAGLLAKSEVLAAQQRYDDAIEVADELIRVRPDSAEGYSRKARLNQAQGNTEIAVREYEKALEKNPDSPQVLSALVGLDVQAERYAQAEERLLNMLNSNPGHQSANMLLGSVYLAQENYTKAERAFEHQVATTPGNAGAYARLAQTRVAADNFPGAIQAYQEGLQILPKDTSLLVGLAGLRERQKNYEDAITLYEQVLVNQPNNAVSTNNLAALLSDHRSDEASLARARELSTQLEKTNQPAFLDTAAWVYYRTGDYDKAAEILEDVVEKAPKVPVFQYHLGMAYSKQGKKDAARKHLILATDGDFSYEGVEEARAALNSL